MITAHDNAETGAHFGVGHVQNRIRQRFYWPRWEKDIREYVLSCDTCQRVKPSHQSQRAPLKIIESQYPFEIITADIAGEFNESYSGNK